MLDQDTIQALKEAWYSFEDIQSIEKWLQDVEKENLISHEQFWKEIYSEINIKMKEGKYVQN